MKISELFTKNIGTNVPSLKDSDQTANAGDNDSIVEQIEKLKSNLSEGYSSVDILNSFAEGKGQTASDLFLGDLDLEEDMQNDMWSFISLAVEAGSSEEPIVIGEDGTVTIGDPEEHGEEPPIIDEGGMVPPETPHCGGGLVPPQVPGTGVIECPAEVISPEVIGGPAEVISPEVIGGPAETVSESQEIKKINLNTTDISQLEAALFDPAVPEAKKSEIKDRIEELKEIEKSKQTGNA